MGLSLFSKGGGAMALWDHIKKGAEEGLGALKEGMAVFMAEAGKQSKIIKKRVELSAVQNNVRKTFIRLGSAMYDLHVRGEGEFLQDAEVKDLIAQIDEYRARVREIEWEIEASKREESSKKTPGGTGKGSTTPNP
jgi:hypothetical protein